MCGDVAMHGCAPCPDLHWEDTIEILQPRLHYDPEIAGDGELGMIENQRAPVLRTILLLPRRYDLASVSFSSWPAPGGQGFCRASPVIHTMRSHSIRRNCRLRLGFRQRDVLLHYRESAGLPTSRSPAINELAPFCGRSWNDLNLTYCNLRRISRELRVAQGTNA